jgi:hypothetical protein
MANSPNTALTSRTRQYTHMCHTRRHISRRTILWNNMTATPPWIGNQDGFLTMRNEAERMGIRVLPPDVNTSDNECSIDEQHPLAWALSRMWARRPIRSSRRGLNGEVHLDL